MSFGNATPGNLSGEEARLRELLAATLEPKKEIRETAERGLDALAKQNNFCSALLALITKLPQNDQAMFSAAIYFKNVTKKYWDPKKAARYPEGSKYIGAAERPNLRERLLEVWSKSTLKPVKAQLGEALVIVGKVEYPREWDIWPAVQKVIQSNDSERIVELLDITGSIMMKYRTCHHTVEHIEELKFIIDGMGRPLMAMVKQFLSVMQQGQNAAVLAIDASIHLVGIFESLHYLDINELFQDELDNWVASFCGMLQIQPTTPVLQKPDNTQKLCRLKRAVIDVFTLYNERYESEYKAHVQKIIQLTCQTMISKQVEKDSKEFNLLLMSGLEYLTSVVSQMWNRYLFKDQAIHNSLIDQIIVPNIALRESDLEQIQMDGPDFVELVLNTKMGSRRKRVCDLVRTLALDPTAPAGTQQDPNVCFGEAFSKLLLARTEEVVKKSNAGKNWLDKDTAIYLVMAVANMGETEALGCTKLNERLFPNDANGKSTNLWNFTSHYVIPELKTDSTKDMDIGPKVVLIDSLQFVTKFRSKFPENALLSILQSLLQHLKSPDFVIHTFAAHAIGRYLVMKKADYKTRIIPGNVVDTFMKELLAALFNCLGFDDSKSNEHIMKCICGVLSSSDQVIVQCVPIILTQTVKILNLVANEPQRPIFNHYLFEAIGISIRESISRDRSKLDEFETQLVPVLFELLKNEKCRMDFFPYVFQLTEALIRTRNAMKPSYLNIVKDIMSTEMWTTKGSVQALSSIIQTFLKIDHRSITDGRLDALLGIFQYLLSQLHDYTHAFQLLTSIVRFIPLEVYKSKLRNIFTLIFQLLSQKKTQYLIQRFALFLANFLLKYPTKVVIEEIEQVQAGIFQNVTKSVLVPGGLTLTKDLERKVYICGMIKVLNDEWFKGHQQLRQLWPGILEKTLQVTELPPTKAVDKGLSAFTGSEVTFNQLNSCAPPPDDPVKEITNVRILTAKVVQNAMKNQEYAQMLNSLPANLKVTIDSYMKLST